MSREASHFVLCIMLAFTRNIPNTGILASRLSRLPESRYQYRYLNVRAARRTNRHLEFVIFVLYSMPAAGKLSVGDSVPAAVKLAYAV